MKDWRKGLRKEKDWPAWWAWELELSSHLMKRMVDRRFTEIDLRTMLNRVVGLRRDIVEGRWVAECRHRRRSWEIIVEPDTERELLVIVTAYPVERL